MMWSAEEEQYLIDNYYSEGCKVCAQKLNRTSVSVERKVQRLGLKHKSKNKTTDSYLQELIDKNYAVYPIEGYVDAHTPIQHRSTTCDHTWYLSPTNALTGKGCPECLNGPTKLYCLQVVIDDLVFYKVGITSQIRTLNRYTAEDRKYLKIMWEQHFSQRQEAYKAEQNILLKYKEYSVNYGVLSSGNTECLAVLPAQP